MKRSASFIFLSIFLLTDKTYSVVFNVFGNLQDRNEFACNTEAILQCIVTSNNNPILWRVGNPITSATAKAAQCSGNSCSVNPAVSSLYNFSYHETSSDTNMTIKNVILAEDGKQYMCDDGYTSLIITSVVQVPPVKETTQISNKTVNETTIITVSTGCVTQRTEQLVTFEWFKMYKNGSVDKQDSNLSSRDDSMCQINSGCISSGSAALLNSITIDEDPTASKVYFQVHILLDGVFLFSITTASTFQPKGGHVSTTKTNPFTHHSVAGTTNTAVSLSTEVQSNATTDTKIILKTTENSAVRPSNEKSKTTYIFIITIIVVVLLGAVVVALYFVILKRNANKSKRYKWQQYKP